MIRLVLGFCLLATAVYSAEDAAKEAVPIEEQREQLQEKIEKLQRRVPKDLQTDLAIISMKIATGYCSPYRVQEFEEALAALPKGKQRRFEKELADVQAHPLWPSLDDIEAEANTP
jgi:hypothetical protein